MSHTKLVIISYKYKRLGVTTKVYKLELIAKELCAVNNKIRVTVVLNGNLMISISLILVIWKKIINTANMAVFFLGIIYE